MSAILTTEDAAAKLHISPGAMRGLLRKGALPGVKNGGAWQVLESDIDSFISARARITPAKPRVSVLGICADLLGFSSEEFSRRRQEELDSENACTKDRST